MRPTRTPTAAALALVAAVSVACADRGGQGGGSATTTGPTTGPTATVPTETTVRTGAGSLDWTTRPAVDAGDGWRAAACAGDGPFYCVSRNGRGVGTLELLDIPAVSVSFLAGRDRAEGLRALAADAQRSSRQDREQGCPPGSRFEDIAARAVPVAGEPGMRYGYTVTGPTGVAGERFVSYAQIAAGRVFIVVASALGQAACVSPLGDEFEPATLERFEPVLDRLVAAMVLPA